MNRALLHRILLSLPIAGLSQAASAWIVEQKINWDGGAAAVLNWSISDRQFRLDVLRGGETRSFVFNGRVFYVCGKLDKAQLDFLRQLKVEDTTLITSLQKGACQEAGVDYATRFFLSPWDALGTTASAGGFGASTTVSTPEIELTGSADTVAGAKCVNFTRTYALKGQTAEWSVKDTSCNATPIKWRQAMGRELGMALIRQPGGKASFQSVNEDLKKMAGMSLTVTGESTGPDADGKSGTRKFQVQTVSAKDVAPDAAKLAMPAGFEIIDPKRLGDIAAKANLKPVAGAKESDTFSGMLNALILGATPGAGLMKAVNTENGSGKK